MDTKKKLLLAIIGPPALIILIILFVHYIISPMNTIKLQHVSGLMEIKESENLSHQIEENEIIEASGILVVKDRKPALLKTSGDSTIEMSPGASVRINKQISNNNPIRINTGILKIDASENETIPFSSQNTLLLMNNCSAELKLIYSFQQNKNKPNPLYGELKVFTGEVEIIFNNKKTVAVSGQTFRLTKSKGPIKSTNVAVPKNTLTKSLRVLKEINIPLPKKLEEKELIINGQKEFIDFWKNTNMAPMPELPAVNFDKESVLFYSYGYKPPGNKLRISNVTELPDSLIVKINHIQPALDNKSSGSVPCYILAIIEKTSKNPKFDVIKIDPPKYESKTVKAYSVFNVKLINETPSCYLYLSNDEIYKFNDDKKVKLDEPLLPKIPDVDFSTKMIIVLTAGKIPCYNYDLIFNEVQKTSEHLNIRAQIKKKKDSSKTKADYPGIGIICDKINLPIQWFISGIGTSKIVSSSDKVNISGDMKISLKAKASKIVIKAVCDYEIFLTIENWKYKRVNLEIIEKSFIVGDKTIMQDLQQPPEIYSINAREYQQFKIFGKCKLMDIDATQPVSAEFKIKIDDNIQTLRTKYTNLLFAP